MYTEDEAKTKWCPMSRVNVSDNPADPQGSYNRLLDGDISDYSLCVASSCMMWKWRVVIDDNNATQLRAFGYCGLAGKE